VILQNNLGVGISGRQAGPILGSIVRALKTSLFVLFAGTMAAVSLSTAQSDADAPPPRDGQHDFDFAFGGWKTHVSRLLHPLGMYAAPNTLPFRVGRVGGMTLTCGLLIVCAVTILSRPS
jgi:hypothetical protein